MSISDWISDVCSSDLADVTFTFGQVGIDQAYVSDKDNCGNLSAAVGVYAIEAGYVLPKEPETEVRIFNTNVRQILIARVPVRGGRPEIGRAHVCTPVTNANLVCRLLLEKNKK